LATVGEERILSPVDAVQRGWQEVLPHPEALKAYNFLSSEPMYSTPLAMVGEEMILSPVDAVQRGWQEVLPHPEALKAYNLLSFEPT
jgi:tRNA G37 N-methylase TrmD